MKTILLLFFLTALASRAEWKPPAEPDPSQILDEARDDASAGRHEVALEKHLWFHRHALGLEPSLYGVRLSFALSFWHELGKVYPPALAKLKEAGEAATAAVKAGRSAREAFHDAASIHKQLGEEEKTAALFVWLDQNEPDVAKRVFGLARPALVKDENYKLCGKYLRPVEDFERARASYLQNLKMAEQGLGDRIRQFGEKSFETDISMLVALLAVNDRADEAADIAGKALEVRDNPEFRKRLDSSREGLVPEPWP